MLGRFSCPPTARSSVREVAGARATTTTTSKSKGSMAGRTGIAVRIQYVVSAVKPAEPRCEAVGGVSYSIRPCGRMVRPALPSGQSFMVLYGLACQCLSAASPAGRITFHCFVYFYMRGKCSLWPLRAVVLARAAYRAHQSDKNCPEKKMKIIFKIRNLIFWKMQK